MSKSLNRREATLYVLLRATLARTEAPENFPIENVEFYQHSIVNRHARMTNGVSPIVSYGGHFVENTNRVYAPFHIAFAGLRQVSSIHNRLAVNGAIGIQSQMRAFMAIMSHLVSLGQLPRSAFDESVGVVIDSAYGRKHNLDEVAANFHKWAANKIKRSSIDYDDQEQSIAELLAYEAEGIAA